MKKSTGIRFGVGAASLALLLTACGGGSGSADGEGSKGGTLYILTEAEQILHLDPQQMQLPILVPHLMVARLGSSLLRTA
jgi:hypothetical protein